MLINGQEYQIDDLLDKVKFEDNMKQQINDHLSLTKYQIEILTRYNIDYASASSLKSLSYLIEDVLNDIEAEDLELIADELAERNYYENTNK